MALTPKTIQKMPKLEQQKPLSEKGLASEHQLAMSCL
jgi:hypothetical protein